MRQSHCFSLTCSHNSASNWNKTRQKKASLAGLGLELWQELKILMRNRISGTQSNPTWMSQDQTRSSSGLICGSLGMSLMLRTREGRFSELCISHPERETKSLADSLDVGQGVHP